MLAVVQGKNAVISDFRDCSGCHCADFGSGFRRTEVGIPGDGDDGNREPVKFFAEAAECVGMSVGGKVTYENDRVRLFFL
jgi:hypothetical protein